MHTARARRRGAAARGRDDAAPEDELVADSRFVLRHRVIAPIRPAISWPAPGDLIGGMTIAPSS